MSDPIQTPRKGALARNRKLIETIRRLNPLLNMSIRYTDPESSPIVKYSDGNVVIELPGVAEGGGLPEGFEEEEVILCRNGEPVEGYILFKPKEEE